MTPEPESGVRGDVIVLGLVLTILTFMFITFSLTSTFLEGADKLKLVAPAIRLTHSASFGLAAFCGVDAYRRGRNGWWLYVLGGGVPLLQWGITAYWLTSGRTTERKFLRWQI